MPATKLRKQYLTRDDMTFFVEDLKGLLRSSIDASENRISKNVSQEIGTLRQEIGSVRSELRTTQVAVLENGRSIKSLEKELKTEIQGVRTELKQEIQETRTELKEEIQGVRTELKEEMHDMEERLSLKIDRAAIRLDDHEGRIMVLEGRA
jgi:gas vesicle protein